MNKPVATRPNLRSSLLVSFEVKSKAWEATSMVNKANTNQTHVVHDAVEDIINNDT